MTRGGGNEYHGKNKAPARAFRKALSRVEIYDKAEKTSIYRLRVDKILHKIFKLENGGK